MAVRVSKREQEGLKIQKGIKMFKRKKNQEEKNKMNRSEVKQILKREMNFQIDEDNKYQGVLLCMSVRKR